MKKFCLSAAAAAAVMVLAQPAAATIYTVTWTGTVASGSDLTGAFGPAPPAHSYIDLAGKAFSATFLITDPDPGALYFTNANVFEQFGGRLNHADVPVSASLTIDGTTHNFSGALGTFVYLLDGYPNINNGHDEFRTQVSSDYGDPGGQSTLNLDVLSNVSSLFAGATLGTPIDITNGVFSGNFAIYDAPRSGGVAVQDADGILRATHVTLSVAPPAGVPEPAAWALMIVGFGGVGATLRRRRAVALTA